MLTTGDARQTQGQERLALLGIQRFHQPVEKRALHMALMEDITTVEILTGREKLCGAMWVILPAQQKSFAIPSEQ